MIPVSVCGAARPEVIAVMSVSGVGVTHTGRRQPTPAKRGRTAGASRASGYRGPPSPRLRARCGQPVHHRFRAQSVRNPRPDIQMHLRGAEKLVLVWAEGERSSTDPRCICASSEQVLHPTLMYSLNSNSGREGVFNDLFQVIRLINKIYAILIPFSWGADTVIDFRGRGVGNNVGV